MNRHLKYNVILWILVLLCGCAAQKPAPVDRSYEEKPVEVKKEVSKCPDVYTVKEGETIFSISIKCAVDYKTLANANGIKKPYFVKKGDQIRFDIIQTQVDEKVVEGKSDVVEISTYNEDIITEQGRIFVADSPSIGETYQEVLQRHNLPFVEAQVSPQDKGARYQSIAARTKPGVVEDEGADSEKFRGD